jgi:hypothetical protein
MTVAGGVLLLLMLFTGCSTIGQVAAPAPTAPPTRSIAVAPLPSPTPRRSSPAPASPTMPRSPATPAPAPLPAPPARVLSTGVEDEQRMRRDAQTRIDGAERLVRDIDRQKLVEARQGENLETIESFLSKAKQALSAHDLQRAFTLADKAYLLADELSRTLSAR